MEATGMYYENLAHYLHEKGAKLSVVLANRITYFSKSLNIKSKTDRIDSKVIAQVGMERQLDDWQPLSKEYLALRTCTGRGFR